MHCYPRLKAEGCLRLKASGNSESGHPQLIGDDSFDSCSEKV